MLTEKQLKISDLLLNHVDLKGGKSNYNDYAKEIREKGYSLKEIDIVIELLCEDYKLTKVWGSNHGFGNLRDYDFYIRLTKDGNKAVAIGIAKFIEEIEYDKQLERDAKIASIKTSKLAIGISFIALLLSCAIPFLSEKCKNNPTMESKILKDSTNNCYDKCGHTQNKSFSRLPLNGVDSSFIEKIKYSIKHDTVFLNELKENNRK